MTHSPHMQPATHLPVMHVYGKVLEELPEDLFIPPDALEIFLETFEGPLDLLLYLIRKNNIDILDIPMAELTRQYLAYIEWIQNNRFELAAEYLLMAAVLIDIKTRMLLPKPPAASEEEIDPRAELVRRLLEYEKIQSAAQQLDGMPTNGRDFWTAHVALNIDSVPPQPTVSLTDLQTAWQTLLKRADLTQKHVIRREELSVREHMVMILKRLSEKPCCAFTDLFDDRRVAVIVVHFLAILELAREQTVELTQAEPGSVIYVRCRTD